MYSKLNFICEHWFFIFILISCGNLFINCQQRTNLYNDYATQPGDPNYKTFVYNNRRYSQYYSSNNNPLDGAYDSNGAYVPNPYDPLRFPPGQPGVNLDHLPRTGWVMENVKNPENVAGHMYRMAIMTLFLDGDDNTLNRTRCMELSLIHDMAECIVGDLTPHCGVPPDEKHQREMNAMEKLASLAGVSGNNMLNLFKEYEEQETPESHFVKELDRFDMILQAYEYEKKENRPKELEQFFESTKGKFSHPIILGLLNELNLQRNSITDNLSFVM